jgi:hypothetical protein
MQLLHLSMRPTKMVNIKKDVGTDRLPDTVSMLREFGLHLKGIRIGRTLMKLQPPHKTEVAAHIPENDNIITSNRHAITPTASTFQIPALHWFDLSKLFLRL